MRRKMWPVYEAEIERAFARHVSADEARAIGDALERALRAAREPTAARSGASSRPGARKGAKVR
jgi:hypothetical protein